MRDDCPEKSKRADAQMEDDGSLLPAKLLTGVRLITGGDFEDRRSASVR